jgi:hypothetical protein
LMGRQNGLVASVSAGRIILTFIAGLRRGCSDTDTSTQGRAFPSIGLQDGSGRGRAVVHTLKNRWLGS